MQETYSNPTILIVDDSQTDRDTYRRYLEPLQKLGYMILDCESGEEALDLCQRDRPQLILLDYLLFDLDGLEFLRQLGDRMETLPPTIMLTGEGSEMVAVEAMKLGVKDYLVKRQLTAQNLVNLVTYALTQQQLQAQVDRQQQQQNLLARIMIQIGASIELPVILQTAVDGVRQLLDCDRAIMYKFSPDLSGMVISQSVLPQWEPIDLQIEQAVFAIQNLESVAKYLDGSKLVVSDIETADLESSDVDMLQQFQVKALLAVPILFHDILPIGTPMVWGLLIVYNCKAARIWQPEELDLIDRLSIQMAIAIQQAELVSDLKIALQQQQALLDIVPVGIAIAEDANSDVIRVNGYAQAMLSVTGDTNASATGSKAETLSFRQYKNGKEIPSDQLPMQLASSQGIVIKDFKMQMVRADGFTQDWLVNAIPLFNEAGEVWASIAAIADVTKLKRIEADLRQSEERYRHLVELIPQLVWTATPEGLLLDVNQRWLDFTGLTFAQAQSEGWEAVIHADDLPMLNKYWELAQQEGKYEAEGRMLQADGQYSWHLHQAIAEKNEQGQIIKWFGTATDIDDRKQLEQEYSDLLIKVQERNQGLDQFTHIVSHDLKAPLRAISNLAQWLEVDIADLIPSENQQHLKLMRSRVLRMEGLIDGLLTYARVGLEQISTDLVSISDLLAEIIDSLAPPSTFSIEFPSALPTFSTKRILLNQVLSNLIGNAIKHHDRPDGKVSISVEESPQFYKFVIADDGKGIDPQQQKQIFNIFQTLDGDKSESTGIGLAIVQKIVESQGGSIWMESSLGQGSVFSFTWR